VLLKDSWRWSYDGFRLEGDVLADLNAAHVRNVPTLLCHAYVDQPAPLSSHCCPSDGDAGEQAVSCAPHLVHYRIAVKEVCLPLAAFKSSRQLVSVIADCFDAHYEAVKKCQTIHRDVSSHNIFIAPTFARHEDDDGSYGPIRVYWRGILSDWKISKTTRNNDSHEERIAATQQLPVRVGTWPYMSVVSLSKTAHEVEVADEIESFFYVLLYNAARFTPNN
ncbi:hypothetical protein LXA43DRAFT_847500, partial [Ganoderma leucocontextum]